MGIRHLGTATVGQFFAEVCTEMSVGKGPWLTDDDLHAAEEILAGKHAAIERFEQLTEADFAEHVEEVEFLINALDAELSLFLRRLRQLELIKDEVKKVDYMMVKDAIEKKLAELRTEMRKLSESLDLDLEAYRRRAIADLKSEAELACARLVALRANLASQKRLGVIYALMANFDDPNDPVNRIGFYDDPVEDKPIEANNAA